MEGFPSYPPIPTLTIPFGYGRNRGGTIPDVGGLRTIPDFRENDLVAVCQVAGSTRWYRYGEILTNTDNGFSYVKPNSVGVSAPGRWELVTGAGVVVIPTQNVVYIDGTFGNDATGMRGVLGRPFATITAGLAVSLAGDEVYIYPGLYLEPAGFTIPASVTVRGANVQAVTIYATATGNLTLVTMGVNTRLEDLTLSLTSTGHNDLTGVLFPGTTAASAKLRTLVVSVNNAGAGAGTSKVCGLLVQSTGVGSVSHDIMRASTVSCASTGSGKKRAILMETSAGTANLRDTNLIVTGGTDCIGAEIDIAGGSLDIDNSRISGDTQDIKQTAGTLTIGLSAALLNTKANGSPFSTRRIGTAIIYAVSGGLPAAATRYLRPGTDPVSASEIKLRVTKKTIAHAISIRALTGPGGVRTVTLTLRKNGVDTGMILVLTGAATSAQFDTTTVDFLAGDDLSLKLDTVAGDATSDPVVFLEMY